MTTIAQLIKLRDYVSRYEWNTYRYPSQYIRLKQENWEHLYRLWQDQHIESPQEISNDADSIFAKFFSFLKKDQLESEEIVREEMVVHEVLPSTEIELRQYFLDKFYPLQLKWATSTITDVSFIDQSYHTDQQLKYFLQRFPDIYLMMYYPIFNIKKAPIDGEIIFISPIGIEIIHILNIDEQSLVIADNDRTWFIETNHHKERRISPLISLKRTERIVQSILKSEEIDLPISKIVLSKKNNIVYSSDPYRTRIIGKNEYDKWFNEKRQLNSTLKSQQLRAAEALLKYCLSTSVKRPEWEEQEEY